MAKNGLRFPDDEDRMTARENLLDHCLKKAPLKGSQLFPHEITKSFMMNSSSSSSIPSSCESLILERQWDVMRLFIQKRIQQRRMESALASGLDAKAISCLKKLNSLDKLLPLVDVSGSMSGTPIEVAIALGILISEINHPAFRHRLLTFETNPYWVNLSRAKTLKQKVQITKRASWGCSTNIEKAFALIEEVIRTQNLSASDIPDLIIFSDMQFDEAAGSDYFETQLERIRNRFYDLGLSWTGSPFEPPRIIFWNLRGDTEGYPCYCFI
jgi:hypothetical protein